MTRGEWRKAQVEAARLDDAVSARYRRESKVDWWSVAATERRLALLHAVRAGCTGGAVEHARRSTERVIGELRGY